MLFVGIALLLFWVLGFGASDYSGFIHVALLVGFILVFVSLVTRYRKGKGW